MADGVSVRVVVQATPSCSSEAGGHISPARAETRKAPRGTGFQVA